MHKIVVCDSKMHTWFNKQKKNMTLIYNLMQPELRL
jgi:hypothetical protein